MKHNEQHTIRHSTGQALDPIEILMKEHEECLHHLARMENAAEYIQTNGFSHEAYTQIAEAIRFIDTVIRQHDEKEEKYLFSMMDRHVTGAPQVMRNEHRELWIAFKQLIQTVEDIEEGRLHGTSIVELVQSAKAVVDHLTGHITKENEVVFPMAKQMLTKEEYNELRESMAKMPRLVP